ncbi:MAG: adenylate/guanylate cyclase domain-containing protein [Anaerolineae bacterium]
MATPVEQLQTLSVYVPPAVARLSFKDPHWQPGGTWRTFYAATVFADISGFTPLAEKLAANGGRGAEELTALLNRVFDALITAAEDHGGRVVKFGGDALSIIWPGPEESMPEAVARAITAAFAMQAAMTAFATVSTSQGQFGLQMKIGLSVGRVLEVHAGGVFGRWEYVLAGRPMTQMSHAENLAQAGQIVADAAAWQMLQHRPHPAPAATGHQIEPGYYRVTHPGNSIAPAPLLPPDWSQLPPADAARVVATLRSYIPGAIANLLESGRKEMLAELKPMTICFVGFEGLDYTNDPEAGPRLSNFMRDTQEIIYLYEGSVNKLAVGDKGSVLLVLFGAPPFFHEDDEVRAVACALGLVKVAARHGLTARVGLAAGSVFAGPLGAPQRREYTVIGDTVNLAARLMQQAAPNQVWVDQTVYQQASRFFEYNELGPLQMKGKTAPRQVYHALHEKEPDQQDAGARYLLTELTGRAKELAVIDQLADRVWDGHGQVLLLSGEAGVGKSRLAGEIVRRWLERGGVPHTGDCVSYGRQTPYLPWRGIISSIAGLSTRLSLEQRLNRLRSTLGRLPLPTLSSGVAPDDYWLQRLPLLADILGLACEDTDLTRNLTENLRRDNIFSTIRAIVLEEARQRPTLVLLEDTHWSDELSLELAADLAGDILNRPVFLALVHRPLGQPVPVPYQRLQSLPAAEQLPVNELDPESSLKLVMNKLGADELPPPLAELILSKGQGNPFFTEELVNALQDMDALRVADGTCRLSGDLDSLELPDTVQKVVLARIDRLNEEEKMTLKVAAVIGRSFQLDLLAAVHPWNSGDGDALNRHLAHLQAEDFTRQEGQEGDPDFLFKHVITQEVAYETMLYAQRRQLHTTIGVALESRYGSSEGEIIDLLAYHFARSDDRQKALQYLHLAGQRALQGHANEAAISYFSEALEVAREVDNVKVPYSLLAGREQAYDRLGNRAAQGADLAAMQQWAEAQNNPLQRIEAGNRQMLLATNLGDYSRAVATGEDTLALARRHDAPLWEARTLTNLGVTCWRMGDYPRAKASMLAALGSPGAAEDPQLRATSLNYLGLIHTQLSRYEQARDYFLQALELYRTIGDRGGEAGCANNIGLLEASLGRYAQAEQYYSQALTICHAIGDRLREGISLNTLGQVNTLLGNAELAKEQLTHSLSVRHAIGDRRGEAFCLHDLGYLYLTSGQTDAAISMFRQAVTLRHQLGETGNYVASLSALGEALLTEGDVYAAEQQLREAVHLLADGSGSGEYPVQHVWWMHGQVSRILGRSRDADEALRTAHQLITEKAAHLQDPELKQSYLTNVRVNAAIMAEFE